MKIGHVTSLVSAVTLLAACARSPEASAPAASSPAASSDGRAFAAPPPAEASEAPVTAAPPPAPGRPLLREQSEKETLPEEFPNLEAALKALNQAKADLDRLALAEPSPVVGPSQAPKRSAGQKDSKAKSPHSADVSAGAVSNPLCEHACRAFSSLSRAAGAVCRLDGDNGAHCTRAKRLVAESERRVVSCACPATGD